ncbi:MAG: hypothetical protein KF817_05025 [Phycisphaeraceae bacterium]|nr:hypothetical protein [Phycisphaeraceae bacterium]
MSLLHCTEEDRRIIADSLKAAVEGPFFPDWEFSTLFGLQRAEVAEIARAWPKVEESDDRVDLAVNNALGNLAGYPHGHEQEWERFLSVPPARLLDTLKRWRLPHGASPTRP